LRIRIQGELRNVGELPVMLGAQQVVPAGL
jgi:hypothetical protein